MVPTVRSILPFHAVMAICRSCGHSRKLDLAALDVAGYGDIPLVELPLRCQCGGRMSGSALWARGTATMGMTYRARSQLPRQHAFDPGQLRAH